MCAHSESCFGDLIEQSGYLVSEVGPRVTETTDSIKRSINFKL